jgi:hypothetical protein
VNESWKLQAPDSIASKRKCGLSRSGHRDDAVGARLFNVVPRLWRESSADSLARARVDLTCTNIELSSPILVLVNLGMLSHVK